MYQLIKHTDILWQHISEIESPESAKQIIRNHHGEIDNPIQGLGEFNIQNAMTGGPLRVDTLLIEIERGRYFLLNTNPMLPAVSNVKVKDGQTQYSINPAIEHHPEFKAVLENSIWNTPLPLSFTPARQTVTQSSSDSKEKTQKERPPKHQIELIIDADQSVWSPSDELTLVAHNVTQDRIQVKQLGRFGANPTSKLFVAEKDDQIDVYAVHPEMAEVLQELKDKKTILESVEKCSIDKLECEKEESDKQITHRATLKLGPPLRFGAFFDGTGNDDHPKNKDEWSNVKKLSDLYRDNVESKGPDFDHGYIRGVGSEGDNVFSKLLGGAGGYGTEERIKGMVFLLEQAIAKYKKEYDLTPRIIQLDIFGFSRGAASARHFMNVIKQGFYGFEDETLNRKVKPEHFVISFAGLFDTVGSFGIAGDNSDWGYNFHVNEDWVAGSVYHFIALNEYRENFDLQTLFIEQNRQFPEDLIKTKMHELGFPGCHSDIGGGYTHNQHGISNEVSNPTLLSELPLMRMHELAVENNAPLNPLPALQAEAGLTKNYQTVRDAIRQDKRFRHIWMKWCAYHAQKDILDWKLENHPAYDSNVTTGHDGRNNRIRIERVEREKNQINIQLEQLERQLSSHLNNSDEFLSALSHLQDHYIHRSHQPFNSTIGMDNEEAEEKDLERPHRTVFYKSEVNFNKRNDELDRIVYQNGYRRKIDRDEFEVMMSEEF